MDSIYLTKDRDWYRAVLGVIMKFEIRKRWRASLLSGKILAAEEILCLSACYSYFQSMSLSSYEYVNNLI